MLVPAVGNKDFYQCKVQSCRQVTKLWSRLDKFRHHVVTKHPELEAEGVIEAYDILSCQEYVS